jgi:hypothetical protein
MHTTIVTRARAEGLVLLLAALAYLWEASRIPTLFQSPGVPGPTAFPELLGICLALAGAWRLLRGAPADEQAEEDQEAAEEKGAMQAAERAAGGGVRGWLAAHGKFAGLWVTLLGYFVFMPELGFPLASALALVLMMRLLGEKRWWLIAAGSVVVTAIVYLAFAQGLGVRLPLGVLSFLGK